MRWIASLSRLLLALFAAPLVVLPAGLIATPPVAAAALPAVHAGESGGGVQSVQADLRRLGYPVGPVDGVFGRRTRAAVRAFQSGHGLAPDGVVGPQTWNALDAEAGPAPGDPVMIATAYGPSRQDNYPYGATDYFGRPLRPGDVAVDPSVIPLGTRLWISGYRDPHLPAGGFQAIADDEGGAILGNRIDIFIDAGRRAVSSFGIQPVHVTILGG